MSFSNKLRTFETAVRLSQPDPSKTLLGWQARAIATRKALMQIKAEHNKEVESLRELYTPKALESRVAPLDMEMQEITNIAKQRVSDDLSMVMTEKRKQLAKCLEAPSEEAVRLLTVLNMRSDLTQAEIDAAAPNLNSNIHSLRLLKDIASRNGLYFPSTIGDVSKIEKDLADFEKFGEKMVESIDKDDLTYDYHAFSFWTHPGITDLAYYSKLLDASFYTAAQMRDSVMKETAERESAAADRKAGKTMNAAKVFLRGDEKLAGISMQFGVSADAIRKANPGVDLDSIESMMPGTSIVVPSGRFSMMNTPGSIIPDQCIPIHYEPAPDSKKYETGSQIDVGEI